MPRYGAVVSFILLICMVLTRAAMLKRRGLQAFQFAKTHRSDWCLPPIVAFFIYHLFANAFDWPRLSGPPLITWPWLAWVGLVSCALAVGLFCWGLVSFGASFRVGIDPDSPGQLITTGAFGLTRNPLYVAFALELTGWCLIFPNGLFLAALCGGCWLFHRQILREEAFLRGCYGEEFEAYCRKVRRYV